MKTIILAGGRGTRISELSDYRPKPMIEVGGMPILWHIMKIYSHYGMNDFIICAGYKQHMIKEWFNNYFLHTSDITFDFTDGKEVIVRNQKSEKWRVTIVDTGEDTMTGGRLKRIKDYLDEDEFLLTYGDGLTDINVQKIVEFHQKYNRKGTISIYNPGQRFGIVDLDEEGKIRRFREKAKTDGALINIGYMVLNRSVIELIHGDADVLEKAVLETLADQGQLDGYLHDGFWQCVDTKRDYDNVSQLWEQGNAPWKIWEE